MQRLMLSILLEKKGENHLEAGLKKNKKFVWKFLTGRESENQSRRHSDSSITKVNMIEKTRSGSDPTLYNAMASPNHDQHLSTNSQFICCRYESIVHQCPSFSCLFHCIPISKTLFSQSELFSPRESRQPWETSEHRLTNPSWTRWMHLSLPTASLVAPEAEYRRRLD